MVTKVMRLLSASVTEYEMKFKSFKYIIKIIIMLNPFLLLIIMKLYHFFRFIFFNEFLKFVVDKLSHKKGANPRFQIASLQWKAIKDVASSSISLCDRPVSLFLRKNSFN
jgi:hypothetical protein